MPKYRTEITHSLSQPEALARMRAFAEYGRRTSGLKGEWTDNTLEFSMTVQGVNLSGKISVEAEVLKFDGSLPILALPFKSWIDHALKKGLQQAGPGDPMSETADDVSSSVTPDAPVVLFLHIPKAGGSTLGEYVYNQCCVSGSSNEDPLNAGVAYLDYGFLKPPELVVPEHVINLLSRSDLRAVIGHFWFGLHEHVTRPCRYVTLLRDPVERVVSLYYYAKLEETMSLEAFARKPPFREVDNDQTRRIAGVDPPVGECTQATLDLARENLRRHFDVVGTTERMDETLAQLKVKLGWNREVVSFPRNVNTERPKSSSLTPGAVAAIRARNELDYELWRYASELLDAGISA